MQVSIWNNYLKRLNTCMHYQKRKILLLVDNAPTYTIENPDSLMNIKVHFLPPNTTAHLQPCDARIINSFKAHYRKLYLQCVLEAMDAGKEISRLNIKKAIDFTAEAWKNVTSQTIINCWQKTEIVPVDE